MGPGSRTAGWRELGADGTPERRRSLGCEGMFVEAEGGVDRDTGGSQMPEPGGSEGAASVCPVVVVPSLQRPLA